MKLCSIESKFGPPILQYDFWYVLSAGKVLSFVPRDVNQDFKHVNKGRYLA